MPKSRFTHRVGAGVGLALGAMVLLLPLVAVLVLQDGRGRLDALETPAVPLLAAVTPRTVTDERSVNVVVGVEPGPEIVAGPAQGTVTRVAAEAGAAVADGSVLYQIDGVDRVGFVSSIPFYRSIASGAKGDDVAELHRLLVLKGMLAAMPAEPIAATSVTGNAIADFAESIGAARTSTFDPAWIIWLPAPDLILESLTVRVGHPAPPAGSVIATTPGRVTSAAIASAGGEAISFAPGIEYVVIIDGDEFSVDTATRSIAESDLPRVTPPSEELPNGIPAVIRRQTTLQALALPSSAVMTNDRGASCVWQPSGGGYTAAAVTLAGARAGVTNIATGLDIGAQVLANPAQILRDPRCP